jgi:hypothetical protein
VNAKAFADASLGRFCPIDDAVIRKERPLFQKLPTPDKKSA